MASDKRLVNPARFDDVEIDGSYRKRPPLPVGDRHQSVTRELHRDRTAREIVRAIRASEVESADRRPVVGIARATTIMVVVVEWKPADGVDADDAICAVT